MDRQSVAFMVAAPYSAESVRPIVVSVLEDANTSEVSTSDALEAKGAMMKET